MLSWMFGTSLEICSVSFPWSKGCAQMALFKTKIMSKSRACRPMASKDGLQFVKPLRIPWLLLFHSTLCGWTAERERGRLGEGVGGGARPILHTLWKGCFLDKWWLAAPSARTDCFLETPRPLFISQEHFHACHLWNEAKASLIDAEPAGAVRVLVQVQLLLFAFFSPLQSF